MTNNTATADSTKLDELYYYTFLSAIEGGINYWARVPRYSFEKDGKDDFKGFSANIQVTEFSEDETDPRLAVVKKGEAVGKAYKVSRSTISKGMRLVASGKTNVASSYVSRFAEALRNPDDADLDALDADIAVQAGIFKEVIFG
jgi:hypothetical protein